MRKFMPRLESLETRLVPATGHSSVVGSVLSSAVVADLTSISTGPGTTPGPVPAEIDIVGLGFDAKIIFTGQGKKHLVQKAEVDFLDTNKSVEYDFYGHEITVGGEFLIRAHTKGSGPKTGLVLTKLGDEYLLVLKKGATVELFKGTELKKDSPGGVLTGGSTGNNT